MAELSEINARAFLAAHYAGCDGLKVLAFDGFAMNLCDYPIPVLMAFAVVQLPRKTGCRIETHHWNLWLEDDGTGRFVMRGEH